MKRKIIGFHCDKDGDWVADLECGHGYHVRHTPPWQDRTWVLSTDGRTEHLGIEVECKRCDEAAQIEAYGEQYDK